MSDDDPTRDRDTRTNQGNFFEPGPTITHYRILGRLGEGGMGVVHKAEDVRLKRTVALKFLRARSLATEAQRTRFILEAQSAASLDHPNICTVYEIDESEGQIFIAMAFIEGTNLKKKISSGPLAPDEALHIAVQIAKGLEAAHGRGIVHRDIKSSNIMVTDRGHARIMDFGLATSPEAEDVTPSCRIIGTPAYMSPEQISGAAIDHRADIWSWAVVLYEMLTARLPFQADSTAALIDAILNLTPEPASARNSAVPAALEQLVGKAMEKDPADRFQSMGEILAILQPARRLSTLDTWSGEPETSKPLPSIAVLPFSDMSAEKDQGYFCDGMAVEIISNLAQVEGLRVAARTSAFAFKEKPADVREIGRKLRVATLLEGSVRKLANRVRVSAQLVNVADGYHLWSERYDRELDDIFAIQEEIAHRIVQALRIRLTEREKSALRRQSTTSVSAYEYYLRGRQFFYRSKREAIEFALEMYSRAIAEDPGYSLAFAGMADSYSYLFMYHGRDESNLEKARLASRKALTLGPELAEAHAAEGLALSLTEEYDSAEREFEQAIRLNPNLFEAHYFYARTCFAQGKLEPAARRFQRASQTDPDDYQAISLLGCTYKGLKQHDKALEAFRRTLKRIRRRLELNPDDTRAYYLGAHALLETGQRGEAVQWAEKTRAMGQNDPYFVYGLACFYAQLPEPDKALDYLEEAVRIGFAHRGWVENDADLDPVRTHPRFRAIMRQFGR